MALDSNTEVLARVPLFSGLSGKQLSVVAFTADWRSFLPREPIIENGRPATSAFVMLTGQARCVTQAGQGEEELLGPGTLLGEMAMFYDTVYRSTVIAARGVGALEITQERLRKMLERDPTIAGVLMGHLRERIQGLAQALDRLGGTLGAAPR